MKKLLTLLLFLVITEKSLAAIATIEAKLSNSHPVLGEQVSLVVDIAVPGYFNGPTRFTLPAVDGLLLRQESQFAVNGSRRIDGVAWATQRWTVLVYPHQSGVMALPAIPFAIAYTDASGRSQKKLLSVPVTLLLSYKPEAFPAQKIAVAESLEIDEYWSLDDFDLEPGQPIEVSEGQVLQRRIEISASGTMAINIPAVKVTAPEGISLHSKEPQLRDRSNRGAQVATLVQSIDYVIVEPGRYNFGGEEYLWWSTKVGGLESKIFPDLLIATEGSITWRVFVWGICCIVALALAGLFIFILKIKNGVVAVEKYPLFNIKDFTS